MSDRDQLIAAATERADTTPIPNDWGYRVVLEPGDSFVGRWRGETVDEEHENRRIFLLWDEDGEPCFSRHYVSLAREVDNTGPDTGCTIVVARGDDYATEKGTGYSFGVVVEPNAAPLPEQGAPAGDVEAYEDPPF
jgi:hypothetical protein